MILAGLIPNLSRAHRICFLSQLFLPVKKDNRAACGNPLRKSKTDRVKRDDDGMRDKEAKYREPCQDARGLNTTAILISLYTFQSQQSFLNLLMFLLLSQPFHHSNRPPRTSTLILSESRIAHVCFKLLSDLWIICNSEMGQRCCCDSFSELILKKSISDLTIHHFAYLFHSSTVHTCNTFIAQRLQMPVCRPHRGN